MGPVGVLLFVWCLGMVVTGIVCVHNVKEEEEKVSLPLIMACVCTTILWPCILVTEMITVIVQDIMGAQFVDKGEDNERKE